MAGVKRPHAMTEQLKEPVTEQPKGHDDVSPFIPMFEQFRAELDEHHDRRERIIKTSRDVTAQSKKIIFALQRNRDLGKPIHASIAKQTTPMLTTIQGLFQTVVPDLQDINAHRYQHNISGGIQEYMEAVLFQHYLETQRLMTFEDAAKTLSLQGLQLTCDDYLLGVFDMTGELMRFAVTNLATTATRSSRSSEDGQDLSVLADMQTLRSELEALVVQGSRSLSKEYDSKLKTTKQSVEKVEASVYSMLVRGKERPKGWRPDADPRREAAEIESF
ncbi:hypothetical protein DV736_g1115, partial [Chaetothyriales sp. CBS 134916]